MPRLALFVFVAAVWFAACSPTRSTSKEGILADVRVEDQAWMNGCRFILATSKGQLLLPVSLPGEGCDWGPQDRYRIRYEVLEDAVFGCTVPKVIPVRVLSCVRRSSGAPRGTGGIKPLPAVCAWTANPYQVPWMTKIIGQINPYRITRFAYPDGGAYWFESSGGHYLLDCRGQMMCSGGATDQTCLSDPRLTDAYVILVRNE